MLLPLFFCRPVFLFFAFSSSIYIFFFLLKTVLSFFSRPYRRGPIYIRVSRVSSSTRTRRRTHTRIKLRTMGFQLYTEMQQSSCNVLLGIEIWRKFIRFERKARVGERGPQQWPIIAENACANCGKRLVEVQFEKGNDDRNGNKIILT